MLRWVIILKIKRLYRLDESAEIPVSERKLQPLITIGFAEKSPRFVAIKKHTIVYVDYHTGRHFLLQ